MKNQRGFVFFELVIILIVLGVLAVVGMKYWQARQIAQVKETPVTKSTKQTYTASEYGFKMSYPVSWGEVKAVQPLTTYSQLSFSGNDKVFIQIVFAPSQAYSDGCPGPLDGIKYDLRNTASWVIGWQGNNLKVYSGFSHTPDNIALSSMSESNWGPKWKKISTQGALLTYKKINENPLVASDSAANCGGPVSKALADEVNGYYDFPLFALNFSNSKVKGINAYYETLGGEDSMVTKQVQDTLLSVKSI